MPRAHGEPTIAELRQNLADRAFMQRYTETSFQLGAQIHTPPADHPVARRIGSRLDPLGQFGELLRRESWLGTWRRQIVQAAQALGIVAMHPIPQGLAIHAAGFGRRPAIRTVQNHRNGQHPPCC